jgi:hypothetical protein
MRQASHLTAEHAEQISPASFSDSAKKRIKHELASAQRRLGRRKGAGIF